MTDDKPTLGEFLKAKRCELRMSMERLAANSGYSFYCIRNIERGLRIPSPEVLQKLAELLQLDMSELTALREEAVFMREQTQPRKKKTDGFAAPASAGRQSELTPEVHQLIVDTYRSTKSKTAAANRAGFTYETLRRWLETGEKEETGLFHDLHVDMLKAGGHHHTVVMTRRYSWAVGGVIERAKCKTIVTDNGQVIRTNEVELDPNTKEPIMVKTWVEPNLSALDRIADRIEPESYAGRGISVTQLNNQQTDTRIDLVSVLKQIGDIPDDEEFERPAARQVTHNGTGSNGKHG